MKKLLLACLALSLLLIPTASGQENGYPACSESEILVLISSMLDYVPLASPSIESFDDVLENAIDHVERRDSSLSLLPLCSAAIVTQRQVIALYSDFAAGSALDYAGVTRSVNPYFVRELVDEGRIDRALQDLMAAGGEGAAPEERSPVRLCSREEYDLLDELAEEILNIDLEPPGAQSPLSIAVIHFILDWREEKLALLPECAQAIELGFRLSKATTDAAALLAFRYAAVPDADNPYTEPVTEARASLSTWRKDLMIVQPQYKGATVLALGPASKLPACTPRDMAFAYSDVQSKILAPVFSRSVQTQAELIDFSQSHLNLRNEMLSQLPLCAEVFEARWRASELLGDAAARHAFDLAAGAGQDNPFVERVNGALVKMQAWLFQTEELLAGVDVIEGTPSEAPAVPECRSGEVSLMISYLMPDLRAFLDAGFAVETWGDLYALYDQSFAHRDDLWLRLPRCREALELGLLMRQLAGDWVAMSAMDLSFESLDDIVYVDEVKRDLRLFDEMRDSIVGRSPASDTTYYVTANPYANIRSCAATSCSIVTTAQNGEALTVVDDSGDWYELQLDDGRTAYIAGFLMSEAQPGA